MSTDEIIYSENNPLTKATDKRRVFERGISDSKFNIYPTPTADIEITLNYYKTPTKPNWNYVVVQGSALYNSTGSVDFSLHKSEEEILVAKNTSIIRCSYNEARCSSIWRWYGSCNQTITK